jgi:hypothetical protein
MNFYWKIGRLFLGYGVGVPCFLLFYFSLGDNPSWILWPIVLWLPVDLVYTSVILVLSTRKAWPNLPGVLEVNGFLIAICPVIPVWPTYMFRFDIAGEITIFHLVVFSVVTMVMIGFHKLLRGTPKPTA